MLSLLQQLLAMSIAFKGIGQDVDERRPASVLNVVLPYHMKTIKEDGRFACAADKSEQRDRLLTGIGA
jgi:hypothetical protein